MANDFNKCIFVGRLGQDPDIRHTTGGVTIANFTIAVGYKYKDQEHTEWVKCVAFGKLSEIISEYTHKGSQVLIEGRLQTRTWDDKDGNKKYTTEIIAQTMQMLGGRGETRQEAQTEEPVNIPDDDIPF